MSIHADLNSPEQLAAFFIGAALTAAALTVWSLVARAARAAAGLVRRQR